MNIVTVFAVNSGISTGVKKDLIALFPIYSGPLFAESNIWVISSFSLPMKISPGRAGRFARWIGGAYMPYFVISSMMVLSVSFMP